MNRQLVEIASWRIVSELMRRYRGRFHVIETHPCSGQYDCLALYTPDGKHVADFNRGGRFHVLNAFGRKNSQPEPYDVWSAMMTDEPKRVLDKVSALFGLPAPNRLPPSTPEVLSYRFIAAYLAQAAFGQDRLECRNGYFDQWTYRAVPARR